MGKDDLTQIKHVGAARMRLLNESGITTIKKLYQTPLEELIQIDSIGERYAKRIKASVIEIYGKKQKKPAPLTAPGKEKKSEKINRQLHKQLNILIKRLMQVNESLKPLGKKKYLASYIDFKKRSKKLGIRLDAVTQKRGDLSNKDKKNIIKKARILNSTLKTAGKKPSKKNYHKVLTEIQSFSNWIK